MNLERWTSLCTARGWHCICACSPENIVNVSSKVTVCNTNAKVQLGIDFQQFGKSEFGKS